jgi:hypothetical protein
MNTKEKRVYGFASNEKEWHTLKGTLDGVQ